MQLQDWFAAGMGAGPSDEVVRTRSEVSGREARRVRRLVLRGEAADDPGRARLAVALARERQRNQTSSTTVAVLCFALLVGACIWLAVQRLESPRAPAIGLLLVGVVVYLAYAFARFFRVRANAPNAELANMAYLSALGQPYPTHWGGSPIVLHGRDRLLAIALVFLFYDLGYGALRIALGGEALTPLGVLGAGAVFALLMTLVGSAVNGARSESRALRPTAGQRG